MRRQRLTELVSDSACQFAEERLPILSDAETAQELLGRSEIDRKAI